MVRPPHARTIAVVALLPMFTTGCNPAYLTQAVRGQVEILRARRPVAAVLADPDTPPELQRKLAGAEDVVRFAHDSLGLPDNGSYEQFADVGRPYVVWNVFAAPEFSLELRRWCFPVAGCVAYRGYFDEDDAGRFAARQARRGDDVAVRGALAYSTLGFFRDPLLSTVTRLPETALVGLVFHELAHQRLYVAGDTVFSESFATLVEQEGVVRWLEARGDRAALCGYLDGLERAREVHALIRSARSALAAIYASGNSAAAMRAAKTAALEQLRADYAELREGWREPPYFDGWLADPLDNASLGAVAAYQGQVGQLRVILEAEGGDLEAFYRRAERLARLSAGDRQTVLGEISRPTERRPGAACRQIGR
ncbi:MAG: aminopeptidase [Gammaproteobacteria bacterium]|nr:aminopeptidase [Gammaproteobacteria bacterium]